jgi:hypothetical protein
MYDKDKIRVMSKMAVYDKRDFERDARASQYFRHDYIYKKNMRMRFFLSIGFIILILFYVLYLLAIEGADPFTLDFQAEAIRLLFFGFLLMIGYSFIGTIVYTREFLRSEKRMNAYFSLMRQLDPNAAREDISIPTNARRRRKRVQKEIHPDDEADFEEHMPYVPHGRATLEYRMRSSDDPEFWEDEDMPGTRR